MDEAVRVAVVLAAFVAGLVGLVFAIPLLATLVQVWDSKLVAWKERVLSGRREADELAEAKAEIQRLRTELAERGMR